MPTEQDASTGHSAKRSSHGLKVWECYLRELFKSITQSTQIHISLILQQFAVSAHLDKDQALNIHSTEGPGSRQCSGQFNTQLQSDQDENGSQSLSQTLDSPDSAFSDV